MCNRIASEFWNTSHTLNIPETCIDSAMYSKRHTTLTDMYKSMNFSYVEIHNNKNRLSVGDQTSHESTLVLGIEPTINFVTVFVDTTHKPIDLKHAEGWVRFLQCYVTNIVNDVRMNVSVSVRLVRRFAIDVSMFGTSSHRRSRNFCDNIF